MLCTASAKSRRGRGRAASTLTLAAWAVSALACRGSTNGEQSSFATRAIVFGRVTTADGAPLARAVVRAMAHDSTCVAPFPGALATGGYAQADNDGNYRQLLAAGHSPFTGCVQVDIIAAGTADQVIASVRGAKVAFKLRQPGEDNLDSVRVDVRVP